MPKKLVVLSPQETDAPLARIAIVGLTSAEEDELYERCEAKYGTEHVSGLNGNPYVLEVKGVTRTLLVAHVRRHCERRGHSTHIDE